VELLEREVPTLEFFETLESDHGDGLVQRRGKAHERRPFARKAEAQGEIPSEGKKAERGSAGGVGNTVPSRTDLPGARIPERGVSAGRRRRVGLRAGAEAKPARRPNADGAGRGESRGGYWKGETSESFNPMDGFGMKQGRGDEGGTRRQEVEKAWRRSEAG
jgi:hypothetical protein